MNSSDSCKNGECRRNQIVVYLDGELSPREELELETHFVGCGSCAEELNEQKRLLCALDFALDDCEEVFDVPDDFTKVVVTSAESNVRGLRRPQERFRALFVCAALFLLVLAGLGTETGSFVNNSENIIVQSISASGYAMQFFHDVGVGVAVVLRCLSQRFIFNSAVSLGVLLMFFAFTSFIVSRSLFKHYRF